MISKKHIIEKIKKNFPSWSDIRRKTENSNGGQVLLSLSEEVEEINKAIEEYKKEFFIESYKEKYDEIIDYLHKAVIGDISGLDFNLIVPDIDITRDSNYFKESNSIAYYDGENITIKGADVPSSMQITYSINGAIMTSNLEKFHVWNQFDEFALFMGLTRFKEESNKQLLKRIELAAKRPPNSSREGLKNVISNLIESKGEDIKKEDISIKGVGIENLNEEVDGDRIVDTLMKINKDVFKEKSWDLDIWNYEFDSMSYSPLKWDEKISNFQDGVGYHDDLKAKKARTDGIGNVEVTLLNKSIDKVKKYIRDINLEENISIPLTKYSNEVNPLDSKFRIEAKNIEDITSSNIEILGYNLVSNKRSHLIDSIILNKEDLIKKETLNINDGDLLEIDFKHDNRDSMDIFHLYTYEDGIKKDLFNKDEIPFPFVYNKDSNSIVNSKVKFLSTSTQDLFYKENVIDVEDRGFTQEKKNEPSRFSIDVSGMKNEILKIDYEPKITDLSYALIDSINFERVLSNSYEGGATSSMAFKTDANYVSFITSEEVEVTVNGIKRISVGKFETDETLKSRELDVEIKNMSNKKITISNIVYSSFDMDISLEKGSLLSLNDDYILPNIDENILNFSFHTKNSEDFIINKIRIGYETKNDVFRFNTQWSGQYDGLYIDTNCINRLRINGNLIDENYSSSVYYEPKEKDALIELDTSSFIEINSIEANAGQITSDTKNGIKTNYIYLKKGEELNSLRITGKVKSKEELINLNQLLNIVPSRGDKVFCLHNENFIITKKDDIEEKIRLDEAIFKGKYSFYEFNTSNEKIESIFVRNLSGENLLFSKKCNSFFKYLYIWTKEKRTHIANNSFRCFNKLEEDIDIVNNFKPMITSNELLFYRLHDTPKEGENYSTTFMNNNTYSIGRKKIKIKSDIDLKDSTMFKKESTFLNKRFVLSDYAFIDRYEKIIVDGEEKIVDIAEFILNPKDEYEVIYSTKSPTSNYDEAIEYFHIEKIVPQKDGFNKLKYSNIDELIYIGLSDWDGKYNKPHEVNHNNYSLLKDKGIITWSEDITSSDLELVIVYTIKIPTRIRIPLEKLYKVTNIPVDAYDLVARKTFDVKVSDNHTIPYSSITDKDFTDVRLRIDNGNIGYSVGKNGVELVNNNREETIVIKNGYYYIGNKEYYMYTSPRTVEINRLQNIETNNVVYSRDAIVTSKSSINYIKNPSFKLSNLTTVFKKEYKNQISGISFLDRVTSCDCFNMWTIENGTMNIVKGLNGLGLEFIPNLQDGYAYLKLPDRDNKTYISFFSSSSIKSWIGKLKENNIIEKEDALKRESSFYIGEYEGKSNYLIITGAGIVDDILLRDKAIDTNKHIKNIDKLRIMVDEYEDFPKTKTISIGRGFNLDRVEVNHNNMLKTTSSISWGDTPLSLFNSNSDWRNIYNENVEIINNSIITKSEKGFFRTRPLHVKNRGSLKSLKFNINKIYLETLRGFTIEVFTGNRIDSVNKKCFESISNFGEIDGTLLDDFVSFKVTMPPLKTITDLEVFSTHRESEHTLVPTEYSSGVATSKVIDVAITSDIKIKSFNFKEISNVNDFKVRVRAAKESNRGNYVWTDWRKVDIDDDYKVIDRLVFKEHRLLQFEFYFKNKNARMILSDVTLEIHEGGSL